MSTGRPFSRPSEPAAASTRRQCFTSSRRSMFSIRTCVLGHSSKTRRFRRVISANLDTGRNGALTSFRSPLTKRKTMLDLEPLGDKVIIKRIDEDAEMKRGLHIPEIAQTKSSKGRVVAVGEGRLIGERIVPLPLEIGDIVLFSKYGATEILIDGEEVLLLRFDEIYLRQKLLAVASHICAGRFQAWSAASRRRNMWITSTALAVLIDTTNRTSALSGARTTPISFTAWMRTENGVSTSCSSMAASRPGSSMCGSLRNAMELRNSGTR